MLFLCRHNERSAGVAVHQIIRDFCIQVVNESGWNIPASSWDSGNIDYIQTGHHSYYLSWGHCLETRFASVTSYHGYRKWLYCLLVTSSLTDQILMTAVVMLLDCLHVVPVLKSSCYFRCSDFKLTCIHVHIRGPLYYSTKMSLNKIHKYCIITKGTILKWHVYF